VARTYERTPWRIEITVRRGVARVISLPAVADTVAAALEAAGAPSPATVGVTLTGDEELAALNARAMGRPEPTDVLSFPLLRPSAFPMHEGRATADPREAGPGFVLPPGEPVHLGDVVVSVERAIHQADAGRGGQTGDVGWAPADELRLLVTHGTLHLCGWDHADQTEEAAMRALERRLLGSPPGVTAR
jgi:probable rRNA maturation factor